jgi:hypothetical protein
MWHTWRSVKFLIKAPFLLLFLVIINVVTSPGHWWVQWAALGIGIAWVISLLRVLRAMILLGGLAALLAYVQKRWRIIK